MPLPSSRDREVLRKGLEAWLGATVGESATIEKLDVPEGAGFSSETYLFDAKWGGQTHGLVTRMGPDQADYPVFPSYDLSLQVKSMAWVQNRSDVPVPNVRWHETDESVLGGEFYVMDRLDASSAPDNPPYVFGGWVCDATPAQRRSMQRNIAGLMAQLHALEIDDEAMAFLNRPQHGATPLDQQLAYQRWYYDWGRENREYPVIERAFAWLEANRPAPDPIGLSWGDSRVGNVLWKPGTAGGEVVAVVDWEMACLGAPATDVAWQLVLHQFFLDLAGLMGMPDPFPDLFVPAEFVADYEEFSGKPLDNLGWYFVFGQLRYAIVSIRTGWRSVAADERPPPDSPEDILMNGDALALAIDTDGQSVFGR